jgi:hypothetical protein
VYDVRFAYYQLFFRLQCRIIFVLQVADGPGQVEIPIDSTFNYFTTRLLYPRHLFLIVWFVIFTQCFCLTIDRDNATAVAGIGYIYIGLGDKADDSGASYVNDYPHLRRFYPPWGLSSAYLLDPS